MSIFIPVPAQWPKGSLNMQRENGTHCFFIFGSQYLVFAAFELGSNNFTTLGSPTTTPIKPPQDDTPHCNTTSQGPLLLYHIPTCCEGIYWTILLAVLYRAYSSTEFELFDPSPRSASASQHSFGVILPPPSHVPFLCSALSALRVRAHTGILIKCRTTKPSCHPITSQPYNHHCVVVCPAQTISSPSSLRVSLSLPQPGYGGIILLSNKIKLVIATKKREEPKQSGATHYPPPRRTTTFNNHHTSPS